VTGEVGDGEAREVNPPPLIKVHPPCLFHARIEVRPGFPKKTGPNRSPPHFVREIEGKMAKKGGFLPK